jgi:hypothetical protein
VPKLPGKRRERHLPTPELAETEALAHVRLEMQPTEAEQALAIVAPQIVNPDTGLARPWEPQPNETAQEYVAFNAWLLTDSPAPNHPLARRRAWEQRRVAYEASGSALAQASPEALASLSVRCIHLAMVWGLAELSKHVANSAQTPQPGATMGDTVRIVKDAAMLARLLHGLSTANVSLHSEETFDLSRLSDDDLATFVALEQKVRQ